MSGYNARVEGRDRRDFPVAFVDDSNRPEEKGRKCYCARSILELSGSVVVAARDNEGISKAKSHRDVFTRDVCRLFALVF